MPNDSVLESAHQHRLNGRSCQAREGAAKLTLRNRTPFQKTTLHFSGYSFDAGYGVFVIRNTYSESKVDDLRLHQNLGAPAIMYSFNATLLTNPRTPY